ncbi:hypothetical protein B0H21DRAFT_695396 [Amylocystis lapponica]|nr:hypothetical protein B0H21DRAFT_695396 [Amylocystis lapponica]
MEENRGTQHGSYIWGRSVHNTRIERLWYDVTHAFGQKWKNFFLDLEANHGLDPRLPAHIWLLHHLFLTAVNQDTQEWAHAWNSHHLQIRGERERSPRDIFLFSMLQDGPRGLQSVLSAAPVDEPVDDPSTYGIDWDVADDTVLMNHLLEHNPQDWEEGNPFMIGPATLSDVPCEPPNCPLTSEEIVYLDSQLCMFVDVQSRNMVTRCAVWQSALSICNHIYTYH